MRLNVLEGGQELFAIVDAGTQDDLGVDLDTRIEKTLEHLDAARGVATYELTAAIGVDCVEAHVHGGQHLVDGVVNLMVGHVGERDEVAL